MEDREFVRAYQMAMPIINGIKLFLNNLMVICCIVATRTWSFGGLRATPVVASLIALFLCTVFTYLLSVAKDVLNDGLDEIMNKANSEIQDEFTNEYLIYKKEEDENIENFKDL